MAQSLISYNARAAGNGTLTAMHTYSATGDPHGVTHIPGSRMYVNRSGQHILPPNTAAEVAGKYLLGPLLDGMGPLFSKTFAAATTCVNYAWSIVPPFPSLPMAHAMPTDDSKESDIPKPETTMTVLANYLRTAAPEVAKELDEFEMLLNEVALNVDKILSDVKITTTDGPIGEEFLKDTELYRTAYKSVVPLLKSVCKAPELSHTIHLFASAQEESMLWLKGLFEGEMKTTPKRMHPAAVMLNLAIESVHTLIPMLESCIKFRTLVFELNHIDSTEQTEKVNQFIRQFSKRLQSLYSSKVNFKEMVLQLIEVATKKMKIYARNGNIEGIKNLKRTKQRLQSIILTLDSVKEQKIKTTSTGMPWVGAVVATAVTGVFCCARRR